MFRVKYIFSCLSRKWTEKDNHYCAEDQRRNRPRMAKNMPNFCQDIGKYILDFSQVRKIGKKKEKRKERASEYYTNFIILP